MAIVVGIVGHAAAVEIEAPVTEARATEVEIEAEIARGKFHTRANI